MTLQIKLLENFPDQSWDQYAYEHKESTFFHLSSWAAVIFKAFKHKPYYMCAIDNGDIQGILPLVHVKSLLFGNSLISQPFCVYGGVLASNPEAKKRLEQSACEYAKKLGVDYIEMRNMNEAQENWPTKDLYVTFRKHVSDDIEKNMLEIPRKQRAMIRKAEKFELECSFEKNVDLFYEIYSESVRNHGTPVFSKKYFKLLTEYFGDQCTILFVKKGGVPISCVMNFFYKNEVLPYYGGGLHEARKYNSFDFMYWQLMCESVKDGPKIFDYGRSKKGSGSYRFKKHWGFTAQDLSYQYYLVKQKKMPNVSPSNPKYKLLINSWKKLPVPLANLIGPHIAKNVG